MNENTDDPMEDRLKLVTDHPSESPSEDVAGSMEDSLAKAAPPNNADESIRVGSPFATDPLTSPPKRPIETFYDVGPIRYTAMGAVAASVMVLGFAAVAAWWFPSGGALIAALGCVLSIFGMYSAFRITSVSLLAIHLALFVVSYGRSIG